MTLTAALAHTRRTLALCLSALCLAGGLAALEATPASAAPAQMAGVQAHLLWSRYDAADRERMLDRAEQAGVRMIRVDVGWASLEAEGKGRYSAWYLKRTDHVVAEAQKRGIEVLFTFWETPCWASTAPAALKQGCQGRWWDRGVQRYPPAEASRYAEALAFMVRRYGGRVAAWELWNEPNHDDYLVSEDQAASYAALVRAAYPAAKAADPDATIIAGSLADADFEFTRALLDRGVGGNFDAWSVHPYREDRSPLHPCRPGWTKKSFTAGVPEVRKTLLEYGQRTPIWLTEFGWSTCSHRGGEAWSNCVNPSVQATYLRQAFAKMQDWSYVPVGVAFNVQDTEADSDSRLHSYGLLRADGAAKPGFLAVAAAARALGQGTRIRTRSRRLSLLLFRRGGKGWVAGRLPVGRTVRVKLHRWKSSQPRFSRRISYNRLLRVDERGRFRHRISLADAASGKWLAVAKGRRRPRLAARAVVR
ncbi:MAG: cellulase family glycosylhydrolase [Egibacteraceae bacterium]